MALFDEAPPPSRLGSGGGECLAGLGAQPSVSGAGVVTLSNGPLSPTRRTVGLAAAPRRFFPARGSRATVAAATVDEAEDAAFPGMIALPLERA
ncbi:hypothetical protein ACQP2E_27900 [Actinoplanes sp. CA-015351]|uniref:hypothetical protein n=1 Tax=Actinoplanes sp. CA-015351 TaxID=3239897 RepID=UPI003D98CEF9